MKKKALEVCLVSYFLPVFFLITLFSYTIHAQTQAESFDKDGQTPRADDSLDAASAEEMARKSSNPLGGEFTILVNQFDNYFMEGDITGETRNINSWLFQPIISVPMPSIGSDWIWVNRPTFSFFFGADIPDLPGLSMLPDDRPELPENNPSPTGDLPFKRENGFGDFVHLSLLGQSIPQNLWGGGDFVWAFGPTLMFPTASEDELGTGKYSAGPAGALGFIGSKFVAVALFQQWWDYGSNDSGRDHVNYSWLNLRYFWNLSDGWQIGGTPEITADWEADDSDERWTVPLGIGVYKTQLVGSMPIKFGVEAQWMALKPDSYGQEWNLRFVVAPIIPSITKLFGN